MTAVCWWLSSARGQRLTAESGLIQGFHLEASLDERIGLTDEEWALIGPLLPPERGRDCRPAQDNRLYFEGMMWMVRTGRPLGSSC